MRIAARWLCVCLSLVLVTVSLYAQQRPIPRAPTPGQQQQATTPTPPPPLAVRVNGREATEQEVTRFAWTHMGRTILERFIDDLLVRQAAARAGITVSPQEIAARITELAKKAGGTDKLIADRGVAGMEALRVQVKTEILLDKLVEAASKVTEQQARDYYNAHQADFTTPTRIHLMEIVTDKDETAYQSRRRIANGEAFSDVAKEVSIAETAEKGGDAGWMSLDELPVPALRPIVATLKVGEVSTPVLVGGKFYILMVADKEPGGVKPFEEVKDQIIAQLRSQRGATREGVLQSLRRRANIQILAEPFKYLEKAYEELRAIRVVANGKPVKLATAPQILPSGRMIVPAKAVFAAAGCEVRWIGRTKTLIIRRGGKAVRLVVGSNEARADGQPVALGEPVQLRAGQVWVTPRPVGVALGLEVKWEPVTYTLKVSAPSE